MLEDTIVLDELINSGNVNKYTVSSDKSILYLDFFDNNQLIVSIENNKLSFANKSYYAALNED